MLPRAHIALDTRISATPLPDMASALPAAAALDAGSPLLPPSALADEQQTWQQRKKAQLSASPAGAGHGALDPTAMASSEWMIEAGPPARRPASQPASPELAAKHPLLPTAAAAATAASPARRSSHAEQQRGARTPEPRVAPPQQQARDENEVGAAWAGHWRPAQALVHAQRGHERLARPSPSPALPPPRS